jgi:hypothetical protein
VVKIGRERPDMSLSSPSRSPWQKFIDVLCYYLWGVVEWVVDVDVSPVWAFLMLELALFLSLILFGFLKGL